jgi:hypothetical protein
MFNTARVTMHHGNKFGILTDTENFSKRQTLREGMMSLVKTNDAMSMHESGITTG